MANAKDLYTDDLFSQPVVPTPMPAQPGAMDFSKQIAHALSAALKDCPLDRYEVAAQMSRLMDRQISKNMLDAWSAESREMHNISLASAIVFDVATNGHALLNLFALIRGCRVMVGRDALLAELGRIDQIEADIAARRKELKRHLGAHTK